MVKNSKTIIVEFNGLPGLGKTTVANLLLNELNNRGYTTVTSHWRKNILNNFHHPFPELYNLDLYHRFVTFARSIPPKRKKRTHVHIVNFYIQKYEAIRKYCDADFAIIDEAIIQFWVAIAFNDIIPHDNEKVRAIINKLKALHIDFIRVDCLNHVDSAATRIKQRPKKNIIFEKLDDTDLISALEAEAANFEYLRAVFSEMYENQLVITIDTNDSPKKNEKKIAEVLKENVKSNKR